MSFSIDHVVGLDAIISWLIGGIMFCVSLGIIYQKFKTLQIQTERLTTLIETLHSDHTQFTIALGSVKGRDEVYTERFKAIRDDLARIDREHTELLVASRFRYKTHAPQRNLPVGE